MSGKAEVQDALEAHGGWMTFPDVIAAVDGHPGSLAKALGDMVRKGAVVRAGQRRRYRFKLKKRIEVDQRRATSVKRHDARNSLPDEADDLADLYDDQTYCDHDVAPCWRFDRLRDCGQCGGRCPRKAAA